MKVRKLLSLILLLVTGIVRAQTVPTVQVYNYTVPQSGGYAPNGNLTNYTDLVTGTWSAQYDNLNRLHGASSSSGPYNNAAISWTYDSFGNRLSQSVTGSPSMSVPSAYAYYDANNRMTTNQNAVTPGIITYDGGDMTFDGTNHVLYDAENRVCAVFNSNTGITTQYLYDADGNRVAKGHPANTGNLYCATGAGDFVPDATYVVGQSGEQVSELDGAGNWVHSNVVAGGQLVATYDQEGTAQLLHFNISDPLGTKRVQASGNGAVELTCMNLPFGDSLYCNGTGQDATEHHFTGKERDTESGLDYFGARYYGSSMGRFMSPDWSSEPEALPYADLEDPQSLNLYSYARNNPISFKDNGHNLVCTSSTSQDSDGGTIHVTETCHEESNPLMLAGAVALGNEEFGPAAWVVGGGLLATGACMQTHCLQPLINLFSKPTSPTPTVAPPTSTPQTPQPPNEPDPKNLTKNVRKIAQKLGKSVREVKDAIHEVKTDMPRGGPVRNPDVLVDTETGEVYPQTPGGHGDSIGNINDHLQ
jgi:RHS repeat-associated protein